MLKLKRSKPFGKLTLIAKSRQCINRPNSIENNCKDVDLVKKLNYDRKEEYKKNKQKNLTKYYAIARKITDPDELKRRNITIYSTELLITDSAPKWISPEEKKRRNVYVLSVEASSSKSGIRKIEKLINSNMRSDTHNIKNIGKPPSIIYAK